jgi:hypothetical protein
LCVTCHALVVSLDHLVPLVESVAL